MEATICESTVLASSLWLKGVPGDKGKPVSLSLLQGASPAVLQLFVTVLAVVLALSRFAVMARLTGEVGDIVGERVPTAELITVLVTVLESVVVLGCKIGTFDTASSGDLISSEEARSDVPLPECVFSVDEDWTLSEDPISS